MPRQTIYDKVRKLLGALTLAELHRLRSEIGDLITLYEQGGVLTGWGSVEEKIIRKKHYDPITGAPIIDEATGEQAYTDFGPYVYVRRRIVGADGRQRLANVGYYGRIEGGLTEEQKAGLLKAHNEGGQLAGEAYLELIDKPVSIKRWESDKAPAERPTHPLGANVTLSTRDLDAHPIFHYLQQVAPAEADNLYRETAAYEVDAQRHFIDQLQTKAFGPAPWRTSFPLAELKRRRFYDRLKNRPRPRFRVWRNRRRDEDDV